MSSTPASPYAAKAAATKEAIRTHVETNASALKEEAGKEIERLTTELKAKKKAVAETEAALKNAREDKEKAVQLLTTAAQQSEKIERRQSGKGSAAASASAAPTTPREKKGGCVIS